MKTLKNFPQDFQPLVIITGDRRENPPKSKGDILAYSVSNTDFMYLNSLNLSGLILSDKQFVSETEEKLMERFGKTNLLVIGSPAVNLLARRINDLSLFKFSISNETRKELDEQDDFMKEYIKTEDDWNIYYQCLEGIVDVDTILKRFVGLEPNIEDLKDRAELIVPAFLKTEIGENLSNQPRPIKYLLHKLDKPGIYDSLSETIRGETVSAYRDYGLISLLKNPFSNDNDFYIIYVAGVHGPGTAKGLELLANNKAFRDHEFGGVYEVSIDRFASYFVKFQESTVRWETRAYQLKNHDMQRYIYKKHIKAFLSSPAGKDDNQQIEFNKTLINLLITCAHEKGYKLNMEEPYTLPMGGAIDFWQEILNYKTECNFIVHDMTNCARGVMVEIGLSIGSKKQYFMIWNLEKSPAINWNMLPSLLPTSNIDFINAKNDEAKNIIKNKIINKAISTNFNSDCLSCELISKTKTNKTCAFIYTSNEELSTYIDKKLHKRKIHKLVDEDSSAEKRICKICQNLHLASFAIIDLSDTDLNSYILLGLSKALGIKTQPLSMDKLNQKTIPWAKEIISYQMGSIGNTINIEIDKFIESCKI